LWQIIYRPDVLPVAKPTASKHQRTKFLKTTLKYQKQYQNVVYAKSSIIITNIVNITNNTQNETSDHETTNCNGNISNGNKGNGKWQHTPPRPQPIAHYTQSVMVSRSDPINYTLAILLLTDTRFILRNITPTITPKT